jgi:hypothetical protein
MCDYDWSSGSFMFKGKQSHFQANRSINLWKKRKGLVRICSTCRKHFPVFSSFMTYHQVCN